MFSHDPTLSVITSIKLITHLPYAFVLLLFAFGELQSQLIHVFTLVIV